PSGQVVMFHVEHAPVHEAAALAGSALDQPMNAGVDDVDSKAPSDLRHGRRRLTVDAIVDAGGGELHADPPVHVILAMLDVNRQAIAAVLHQAPGLPRPERSAAPDQEEGLQQARLSSTVRAEEIVAGGVQSAVDVVEDT